MPSASCGLTTRGPTSITGKCGSPAGRRPTSGRADEAEATATCQRIANACPRSRFRSTQLGNDRTSCAHFTQCVLSFHSACTQSCALYSCSRQNFQFPLPLRAVVANPLEASPFHPSQDRSAPPAAFHARAEMRRGDPNQERRGRRINTWFRPVIGSAVRVTSRPTRSASLTRCVIH
jgi:hypothetical protein